MYYPIVPALHVCIITLSIGVSNILSWEASHHKQHYSEGKPVSRASNNHLTKLHWKCSLVLSKLQSIWVEVFTSYPVHIS